MGKDKAAASPDPRYCQACYDFLCEAMKTDTRWRQGKAGNFLSGKQEIFSAHRCAETLSR